MGIFRLEIRCFHEKDFYTVKKYVDNSLTVSIEGCLITPPQWKMATFEQNKFRSHFVDCFSKINQIL